MSVVRAGARRRVLNGWLASDVVSVTGTRVSMIALPFFVLAQTGSAFDLGLVAFVETVPMVVLKALGGPLIDRVGARRVSVGCDVGSLLVVGSIPLLHDQGVLPFWALLVLVGLAGALRGPGDAAKHSMVPAVAASAGVSLERVAGLSSTAERTSTLIGAALAGALVGLVGPAHALLVDAASFGVAAALLWWATRPLAEVAPSTDDDPAGATPYLAQLREGLRFLRGDRVLVLITAMVAVTNLLDAGYAAVLVPLWAVGAGGAGVVGLLFATFGASAALAALCAARWAERLPRRRTYVLAFLLAGAPRFLVLALDLPLVAVLGVTAIAGFGAGFINPVLGAVIFERIPPALVGRVSSLTSAICYTLIPFGGLLAGALAGGVGVAVALGVFGTVYLVVTLAPTSDPRWRELDRAPATTDPVTA